MKLVYWVISREFPNHTKDEDIHQTGMVGLCLAAEKWDESRCKFTTFAYYCIKTAILNEFKYRKKHSHVISLDYDIIGDDGTKTPVIETIAGDPDVMYFDDCEDQLTPLQRNILALLKRGVRPKEVAKILGCTKQNVYWTQRKIRILRSQTDRKG